MQHPHNKKDVFISFKTIAHVYDSEDPSPEECRELTDRAEEDIARTVTYFIKTVPRAEQGDLILYLPQSDLNENREHDLPRSVTLHFQSRISDLERDRKIIWWGGLREFRLTIAVLIPALIGIGLTSRISKDVVALITQNILVICCWVVIWQPFQVLVFDRWTLAVKIRVYRHISRMNILVKPTSQSQQDLG